MAKVLDCGLEENEVELQLFYSVYFRTNIIGKLMNLLISSDIC